ncbi:hypothetical protein Drose_36510 [Dactylosporangium roseum]|uniref:Ribokinase n=1 Tax=Dactylosporangium roseum TaxID=47989 RepID=A0ABY5Z7V1_9ACTN|nr:PfkB family carbohydrate kinase [Dactylosporangium roseum]UWZ36464.1 hypothetical protein Drose_36510 [Dactylosporangium roseum]
MTVMTVGAYAVDLYMFAERLPTPGESITATDMALAHGGKAANAAVAAARLGATVEFVGALGRDQEGDAALAALRAENIDVAACQRGARRTAHSFITVDTHGRQHVTTWPGAAADLTAEHVRSRVARLTNGAVLVLQGEIPVTVSTAAALAAGRRVTVLLNPSPTGGFTGGAGAELMRRADVLVLNADECGQLSEGPGGDIASSAVILRQRVRARAVVVTLGERGALVVDESGTTAVQAPPVTPVDSTGAGDCFTGVLAAALAAGVELVAGAALACRAAAVSVTRRFCMPSYPTAADLAVAPLRPGHPAAGHGGG